MSVSVVSVGFIWLALEWLAFLGPGLGWLAFQASLHSAMFRFSCWLRVDNYFIWSFIGPVSFVIVVSGTPSMWVPFVQVGLEPNPGPLASFSRH